MSKDLTNLRSLARYFATGDSTNTNFSDDDTLLMANARYQESFVVAANQITDWQISGNGKQTESIVEATRQYTLETDLYMINRVEIKYPSTGDYKRAKPIDYQVVEKEGLDNYNPSSPEFDLKGRLLDIFVGDKTSSISAVTSGILIYYQTSLTEMSVAGSTIIFPDAFARYIALGMAIDYCGVEDIQGRLNWLRAEHMKAEAGFIEYLSNRNTAKRLRISMKQEDYGENGLSGVNKLNNNIFND